MFTLSVTQNVFLTWLHPQLDSGEQSIRAWRKAGWGQEAKLSMFSSKQKANPDFMKHPVLVRKKVDRCSLQVNAVFMRKTIHIHIHIYRHTYVNIYSICGTPTYRYIVCWFSNFLSTHLTPAEKLTTGKRSPSAVKFSSIPCTGSPLTRKEMQGALRSRQQLTTSSFFNRWGKTELTLRPTQPDTGHNVCKQTGSDFFILHLLLILS